MPYVWDRDEGESAGHFAMFVFYRDLGPVRTYEAVRREFNRSPKSFREVYVKRHWRDRALAYDAHLDQVRQGANRLIVHNMAQRQAALGVKMQVMAEKRLGQYAADENLMATVSVGDAIKLASEGVRIERLAEGETTGDEGQPIIFNIAGSTLPKWAPKQVQDALVVEGVVESESGSKGEAGHGVDVPTNNGEAV